MVYNGEGLYEQHAEKVYRYLFALSGEADTAEELTQETFCQALKSLAVRHCQTAVVKRAAAA